MEKQDIRLMIGDIKFSCRAVAVIEKNGKILFQKRKGDANWALPGGAIATMESGAEVVIREIEEEIYEGETPNEEPNISEELEEETKEEHNNSTTEEELELDDDFASLLNDNYKIEE